MATQQCTQRLCSEIQLFDLCDLDVCSQKEGRYCINSGVLERFEAIKEEDPEQYLTEELDGDEESEELVFDETYGENEYGDDEFGDEEP